MQENQICKPGYRLVASVHGENLMIEASLLDELHRAFMRDIRNAGMQFRNRDRRALAQSVEWERLGQFMMRADNRTQAARAYSKAALCCLDGTYYEYRSFDERRCVELPCRELRRRFFHLTDCLAACCRSDARLDELFLQDSFLREVREQFIQEK